MPRLAWLIVLVVAAPVFADEAKWTTDPYPLLIDPTGASLVDVDKPVVVLHEQRELRFASRANADAFAKDPGKYLAETDKRIIAEQAKHYPLTTCVVSDEPLDAMGKPAQRVVGNRLVQLCCGGCAKKLPDDPAAVVQKLDEAAIAQQDQTYALETCPVSGGELGSMGEPVRYVFANRLVKFCCGGCVEPFRKNITQHLSKLPPVKAEAREASEKPADGHAGHQH